ncbi:MAG: hypothetical protein ACPG4T_20010 [Nannocystaceae bacterium]
MSPSLSFWLGFSLLGITPLPTGTTRTADVEVRNVKVQGGIDRAIVERIARHNRGSLRACQRRHRNHGALAVGTLRVGWYLYNRRPAGAWIRGGSLRNPALRRCVTRAVKRWEHPSPRCTAQISATFVFTTDEA